MVRFAEYIKYVSEKSDNQENSIVSSLSVGHFKVQPKQKKKPTFLLEPRGERSLLDADSALRVPLTFNCIQCLILKALLGEKSPQSPLWCNIFNRRYISNVTVVIVDGWDLSDLEYIISDCDEPPEKRRKLEEEISSNLIEDSNLNEGVEECSSLLETLQESLPFSSTCFPLKFEVASPSQDPIKELFSSIPMSKIVVKALKEKYGSLRIAAKHHIVFPMSCEEEPELKEKFPSVVAEDHKDQFNRLNLLLSAKEMTKFNYPLGLKGTLSEKFVPLHSRYEKVTKNSPMYGVDCEMVQTVVGLELSRVSVVDEKLNVIYSSFVKPGNHIVNFLTRYSGVTPDHLMNVTTSVFEVRQKLREILPKDCILVGHSLENDLIALKLLHPYVIDTSFIYNLSSNVYSKPSLKLLMKIFLDKDIQDGNVKGHDPSEDAASSLELTLLKLRNDISFGDINKGGKLPCSKSRFLTLVRKRRDDRCSSLHSAEKPFGENYGSNLPKIIRLEVDNESIAFTNSIEIKDHLESYGVGSWSCQTLNRYDEALEANLEAHTQFKFIVRHCKMPDILSRGKSQKKLRKKLRTIDEKLISLHKTMPEHSLILTLFTKKLEPSLSEKSFLLLDFKGQDTESFHKN